MPQNDLEKLLAEGLRNAQKEEKRRAKYEEERWRYLRTRKKWKIRKQKFNEWRNKRG